MSRDGCIGRSFERRSARRDESIKWKLQKLTRGSAGASPAAELSNVRAGPRGAGRGRVCEISWDHVRNLTFLEY